MYFASNITVSQVLGCFSLWWHRTAIPALERQRQEYDFLEIPNLLGLHSTYETVWDLCNENLFICCLFTERKKWGKNMYHNIYVESQGLLEGIHSLPHHVPGWKLWSWDLAAEAFVFNSATYHVNFNIFLLSLIGMSSETSSYFF